MVEPMPRYSVRVAWSEEDETFIARCPEFPDLAADGPTYQQAITELQTVLEMAAEVLEEDDAAFPQPRYEVAYSGNLSLRLGSHLHRRVAEQADVDGVSINSLLQTAIAYCLGIRTGVNTGVLPTHGSGGLRPGVDLNDPAALLDAMEDG